MIDQTAEALIYLGNRAVEQGNEAQARWFYEEGLAIWRALDDAPCMAHALERLRMLEANPPSTKWAGARSLHSARHHSPVPQQLRPGREGTRRDHTSGDRSAVFRNGQTSILHQGETAVIEPGVWHA
jgi:hypothetical protein